MPYDAQTMYGIAGLAALDSTVRGAAPFLVYASIGDVTLEPWSLVYV